MEKRDKIRVYTKDEAITFRKTNEQFGGLSNMAPGFIILINGLKLRNSEVLYQLCRYYEHPNIQNEIINEISPMTAKMISKKYHEFSRSDWNNIRVSVMRWCLRAKLMCNPKKFGDLLLSTNNKYIVEESSKDDFWGAYLINDEFIGQNVLGRLLMELREEIRKNSTIEYFPKFSNARILNMDINKECVFSTIDNDINELGFG